jgi:beta-barrel assembly-enhancing protease
MMPKSVLQRALALAFAFSFGFVTPAHAQLFDFNKIIDTAKKVTETAKSANEATREFSQEDEIALGEGICTSFLGAAPLYADEKVQKYVNRVGRWLASQTERADLPWTFGVIDTETINAFAMPGGSVFVSSGLLKRLNSESELAGVLAHEIAHVLKRHQLNAIQSNAGGNLLSSLGKEAASQAIGRRGGDAYGLKTQLATAGVEAVKNGVFLRPLDRSMEYEADRLGVVIAARAGYDPYGLVAVLQMLQSVKDEDAGISMFKTHPSPSDRIAELEKMGPEVLDRYSGQAQVQGRFKQMVGVK